MPVPFVFAAISAAGSVRDKINAVGKFVSGIQCKLKGSCSPKFSAAVNASGGPVGYRRYMSNGKDWYYFLNTTEHLTWHAVSSEKDGASAREWYYGNGYWDKLKNAGLDNCCLKEGFPPSEAFPKASDGRLYEGLLTVQVGTRKILVDKVSFDANTHKFEDPATGKQETAVIAPTLGTETKQAGLGAVIPLAIAAFTFLRK